mmetsp:Transcript_30563/g.72097  ORF Transcript_30563/g.72097 Transcript_30563/m.72097 type:complete len:446 (-) Transcript_30563:98-1435(-)
MISQNRFAHCCWLLLAARSLTDVSVYGLSSSPKPSSKPKRPLVSLTGSGDVSGFLYGKLQRATSLYGSGLTGPATAVVHGDRDTSELLPPSVVASSSGDALGHLDRMLWNQFGMATCEGSVDREDLLTEPSYLKPRLADLKDTMIFLDATTTSMGKSKGNQGGPGSGRGGLEGFFSLLGGKKEKPQTSSTPTPSAQRKTKQKGKHCWVDVDLVRCAMVRGSQVFVVCESHDTIHCARALNKCLREIGEDNHNDDHLVATIVSPEEGVTLGGAEPDQDDSAWESLRSQDLEGELSQAISVRDATRDFVSAAGDGLESDNGSRARLAAASSDYVPTQGLSLSRHDLAEVCVQCALRLPSGPNGNGNSQRLRVVRVIPCGTDQTGEGSSEWTERPNQNYFSMMGGKKSKAREGTVSSVNWVNTLAPLVVCDNGDGGSVRDFPKRPSAL